MRCSRLALAGLPGRFFRAGRTWLAAGLLCLQAGQARADWLALGGSGQSDAFIDPATVQTTGRVRRVWSLHNLRLVDKDGDRSYRSLLEYDCQNLIYRSVETLFYAEAMAQGRPSGRNGAPSPWRAVEDGSISAAMQKLVCAGWRK